MTALVAVCLTLINPCCFRIFKSFLVWLFHFLTWLGIEWQNGKRTERLASLSTADEHRTPLLRRSRSTYRTVSSQGRVTGRRSKLNVNRADASCKITAQRASLHAGRSIEVAKATPRREGQARSSEKARPQPKDQSSVARTDFGTKSPLHNPSKKHESHIEVSHPESSDQATRDTDDENIPIRPSQDLDSRSDQETTVQGPHSTSDAGLKVSQISHNHRRKSGKTQDAITILRESKSNREVLERFGRWVLHIGAQQWNSPAAYLIAIVTALFGLFVALTVANIFSAKIKSDKVGLSDSVQCGIWEPDPTAGREALDREDLKRYTDEAQASQYARNCYDSPEPTRTLSCGYFYNQSITFTTKTDVKCPFASHELCLGGLYSAVTFDTGLIEASVLGINTANPHKFRRTTTCTPGNMSERYIRTSSRSEDDISFYYYYGPLKDEIEDYYRNYTFSSSGNSFDWIVPGYSVR